MRRVAVWSGIIVCLATVGGILAPGLCDALPAPSFEQITLPNQLTSPSLGGIGDVNGDGLLDLIVGSFTGPFVLPGDGLGKFPNWYRAGDGGFVVSRISTADFNEDGLTDIVVGGAVDINRQDTTSSVRVLLADRDGFRTTLLLGSSTLGSYTHKDPHVGDFNGDGHPDFLVSGEEFYPSPRGFGYDRRDVLATYLGDGKGAFNGPIRTLLGIPNLFYVIPYVGDLNGDGCSDLVVSDFYHQKVTLSDCNGGFQTPSFLILPPTPSDAAPDSQDLFDADIAAADFNGDGHRDLLVRFSYDSGQHYESEEPREFASLYLGDGTGRFAGPVGFAEAPGHQRTVVDQLIADLNGDGHDDLVLTSGNIFDESSPLYANPNPTDVYLALPGGGFDSPVLSPLTGGNVLHQDTTQTGLRDLNGDGLADLVTSAGPEGLNIALGDTIGHFQPAEKAGAGLPAATAVGDFNGDGNADLAVANSYSYNVSIWLGDGVGGWTGPSNYQVGVHEVPIAIVTGDFNADGNLDLVTASAGGYWVGGVPGVSVLYGDGNGHFNRGKPVDSSAATGLIAADFDRDGTTDLAVGVAGSREVDVYFDLPGTARRVVLQDTDNLSDDSPYNYPRLAAADFDGNGLLDVVRTSPSGGANVFLNVGDPALRRMVRVPDVANILGIAAGDLDGDGAADLVFSTYSGISVQRGDGHGGFGAPQTTASTIAPNNLAIADFDGSGRRFLVTTFNGLVLFPVDAGGRLGAMTIVSRSGGSEVQVSIADVNHDGLLDVMTTAAAFLNLGTCGNGHLDAAEECDDGNTTSCDGCSTDCHLEVGARCGDGIVNAACGEECDAGAANAQTPDSCRTDCRLPRCGDGVQDSGEACDDGNTLNCDGCSTTCSIDPAPVCGDNVVNSGCGEECDDGAKIPGDGCSDLCKLEFIPGGGPTATDCLTEWLVVNPHNGPLYDVKGRLSRKQRCRDNDPACDFDGGVAGSCTFHVNLCVNISDSHLPRCTPATLTGYAIVKPSLKQATTSRTAAAIRTKVDSITDVMLQQPYGACSETMAITIPVGKQLIKTRATTGARRRDTDSLLFTCTPNP